MSIVHNAINILNQPKEYLEKISKENFQDKQDLLSGASIGEHTRHFIEFFECLIVQSQETNCINYDKRSRNKTIEKDPLVALEHILQIQEVLTNWINSTQMNKELSIESSMDGQHVLTLNTNLARELLYNIEHTIHHLAIIKIGLKTLISPIPVSDNFGVANSTINYRNQKATSLVTK